QNSNENGYQKFLRQHYDNPKTSNNNYCNAMMEMRCMTNLDPPAVNKCKEKNTFIHSTKNQIIAVCDKAGVPLGGNLRRSTKPFSVSTCKIHGDPNVHPCKYRGGGRDTRQIVIACENRLPVHLDETQIP
uniref:Ribonuclease A-domain domain-containing protein n=1 Tax=Erpetoichthys calabaricus TaxID=27687 RepID=A0A8C4SCQ3_ERPCA